MDNLIRILILEDCATDADLMEFELQEAGIRYIAQRVITKEDFTLALKTFSPDIILSDYDLPQYSGTLALAEVKSRQPEIPFILVTGAINEDLAAEILANGAHHYVMKKNLSLLGPAVRKAVGNATR